MRTLNLGIVAHVDAGKTSLTERLLFAAGVIDAIGRVDHGNTQTDTLAVERERGITVKSAVVSFVVDDVIVNLIDTPGHPDFIAEVDRVLALLDGAVLVLSAVEGVQAQTRVLMRALQRLGVPTLMFVNKIDRMGADPERVMGAIKDSLSAATIAMGRVDHVGTRDAIVVAFGDGDGGFVDGGFVDELTALLAEHDDHVLARFLDGDDALGPADLRELLASATQRAQVHPVVFGSAMTGAGVAELMTAITALLPAGDLTSDGPTSGVVFKIEHASSGERTAIVRMCSGVIRTRDRVAVGSDGRIAKVTKIALFDRGGTSVVDAVAGGQIARLSGLGAVRIGDAIGVAPGSGGTGVSPPLFHAIITPVHERDRRALRAALERLTAEDPFIDVRHDDVHDQSSVSLYGDVQREVIADTLQREFGIDVEFSDTTTIHIERVAGRGEASEMMFGGRSAAAPFLAGVGLRVEPAADGAGVEFSSGIELGRLPTSFANAVEDGVRETLRHGLHGWEIPDCTVTMIASGYWPRQSHAHATFDKNMSSIASDFRLLTPLVLVESLRRAGTVVHEPVHRFQLEAPVGALNALVRLLAHAHAMSEPPEPIGSWIVLRGLVPAARLRTLRQQLPGTTGGDGSLESTFHSYRPIHGPAAERPYPRLDPRDRASYLRQITGRP